MKKRIIRVVSVLLVAVMLSCMLTGCTSPLGRVLYNWFRTLYNMSYDRYYDALQDPPLVVPAELPVDESELRKYYNLGHNSKLEGNILVMPIFVNDDESSWGAGEPEAYIEEQVVPALDFLEKKAREWGKELEFTVRSHTDIIGRDGPLVYNGTINREAYLFNDEEQLQTKILGGTHYSHIYPMQDALKRNLGVDEVIFLYLINKDGVSFTTRRIPSDPLNILESCVVFNYNMGKPAETRAPGSRSAFIAWRILILYGAEKFYNTTSREEIAELLYPNDICLWQYSDINRCELGEATAYYIGWTDEIPDGVYFPEWHAEE